MQQPATDVAFAMDGDAKMNLGVPSSPAASPRGPPMGYDDSVFLTPDSPHKMMLTAASAHKAPPESKYPERRVDELVKAFKDNVPHAEIDILVALVHLSGEEKIGWNEKRVVILCREMANALAIHVYMDTETENSDPDLLYALCFRCPRRHYQAPEPNGCIEHMTTALLPKEYIWLIGSLMQSLVVSHLVAELRASGNLPNQSIAALHNILPRAAAWISRVDPQETVVQPATPPATSPTPSPDLSTDNPATDEVPVHETLQKKPKRRRASNNTSRAKRPRK